MLRDKLKGNKGVTLVALIVTIVILIILTLIAVRGVSGKGGLINKTKQVRRVEKQTVNKVIENKAALQEEYNDMISGSGSVGE